MDREPGSAAEGPLLEVSDLRKSFASVAAVGGIGFTLRPGEIFALLGPNGAGKTTTVRMLTGLVLPDGGTIRYRARDGRVHARVPAEELGYLPEERGLYLDQPALRQLVYFARLRGRGRREAESAAREGLSRLGLADRATEKVGALSKGNQQKVQLLAAILHGPRLAILDEPFTGFDPVNQELALEWIRELRDAGTSFVLSAHQMALVERLADVVLLLDEGRSVRYGTVSALRAAEGRGRTLTLDFLTAPDPAWLESLPGVTAVDGGGGSRVTLLLRPDADLSDVLASLGPGPRLAGVASDSVSLHDVYLRAVGAKKDGAA